MNAEMLRENEAIAKQVAKIKHKIVVMSGKGGVGKSTISTNLAYGLALNGFKVGILDADIHGPNLPLMAGIEGKKMDTMEPIQINSNLKMVSLSMFVQNSDEPVIWRGPAKTKAIRQMIGEVNWGELDYLVVDLPPGTGDEPLTIAQNLGKIDGSIIVTTPQNVALMDARKSVKFSTMLHIPILGIVENMSGFVCPHCHKETHIFKVGGGEKAAEELELNLLGRVPLTPGIVDSGDNGKPFVYWNDRGVAAKELNKIVEKVIDLIESETTNKKGVKMSAQAINIAFPTNDRESVEEHFGHCQEFAFIKVEGEKVITKEYLKAPPHQPGLLPKFLGEKSAHVIISGGMGARAIELFKAQNIEVILGASGSIEENLKEYTKGLLESSGSACSHDHDEEHQCNH